MNNMASNTEWNVYRFVNANSADSDGATEWVGSAPTEREATELALRLGATQLQHGLDGRVVNL